MESVLDFLDNYIDIIIFAAFGLLAAAAAIRSMIKVKKGKKISITPVGVFNDLPESVTGIKTDKTWEIKEENQPLED